MNPNIKLYQYSKNQIGKKLAKKFGSLGCVESLRAVFKGCFNEELIGSYSTSALYKQLLKDVRFEDVTLQDTYPAIQKGAIIISPTKGDNHGHVGILSDNGKVMSNNSTTLCWDEHLDISIWGKRYSKLGVYYFQLKDIEEQVKAVQYQLLEKAKQWLLSLLKISYN